MPFLLRAVEQSAIAFNIGPADDFLRVRVNDQPFVYFVASLAVKDFRRRHPVHRNPRPLLGDFFLRMENATPRVAHVSWYRYW